MNLAASLANVVSNADAFRDAAKTRNARVLASLLGPAWRGFAAQAGRGGPLTTLRAAGDVTFRWDYECDQPEFGRLYKAAKESQWDAATQLDWSTSVDPQ